MERTLANSGPRRVRGRDPGGCYGDLQEDEVKAVFQKRVDAVGFNFYLKTVEKRKKGNECTPN